METFSAESSSETKKGANSHGLSLYPPTRLPWWLSGSPHHCNAGDAGIDPWVGKIPWRRKWQPAPVFLPRKSHSQRSLAGCCPQDFPGRNTGAGCHFPLQGIVHIQRSNLHLLHWQADSLPLSHQFSSVQFSRSVVSDSLQPHELQHARPPCPSPTPGVHSDSHPSSQ